MKFCGAAGRDPGRNRLDFGGDTSGYRYRIPESGSGSGSRLFYCSARLQIENLNRKAFFSDPQSGRIFGIRGKSADLTWTLYRRNLNK